MHSYRAQTKGLVKAKIDIWRWNVPCCFSCSGNVPRRLESHLSERDGFILKLAHPTYKFFFVGYQFVQYLISVVYTTSFAVKICLLEGLEVQKV